MYECFHIRMTMMIMMMMMMMMIIIVGRASDSRSRGAGFEARIGHLVVGSDLI